MVLWETLILVAILLVLLYKWSTAKYGTLKERGVDHDPPKPLIGNTSLSALMGRKSFMSYLKQTHQKFKNSKIYGIYNMRDPIVIIRDIDLLKKIAIKDFDYFPNHRSNFSEGDCLNRSVLALQDLEWKEMRNTLTPTFTGSKMRLMFELINECCIEGVKYLRGETKAEGKGDLELEMKEFFTRFANDVIASAAFGIKINSFEDKSNEFFRIGRSITEFKAINLFKAVLVGLMPKVTRALKISFLDEKNMKYFNNLVLDAVKYREQHKIVRNDMIHLLMEAKKQHALAASQQTVMHNKFDDEDLVAQCLIFFFAGFDTVSTCLSLTAHELLLNPAIQQELYEEISAMEKELAGKPLNYDALVKMKYMDMVLSESLRKWPPAMMTDRVCSKDYTLRDDDGNVICNFKKNDNIWLPIIGLHHDPEHFPNPNKFDPERFSNENKDDIKPMTYIPFGVGPRNCIGNRLALMEIKALLYHMLLHFKIVAASKTVKDMEEAIQGFQSKPKGGFWMKFVPRTN